jgi:hypothetical protein
LEGLQAWKADLEERYRIRNEEVDAQFLKNKAQFSAFEKDVRG